MTDTLLPEDTAADHLAHLDSDISTYTEQLTTLQGLAERQQQQLDATNARITYITSQLDIARQARADFVKSQKV